MNERAQHDRVCGRARGTGRRPWNSRPLERIDEPEHSLAIIRVELERDPEGVRGAPGIALDRASLPRKRARAGRSLVWLRAAARPLRLLAIDRKLCTDGNR